MKSHWISVESQTLCEVVYIRKDMKGMQIFALILHYHTLNVQMPSCVQQVLTQNMPNIELHANYSNEALTLIWAKADFFAHPHSMPLPNILLFFM